MIDVSAAYPNTSYQYLLYNLLKRRIDIKVVNWIALFLTHCQTIIKTNKLIMPKLFVDLDFSQGLPLSYIFYLFYNTDLLDDCTKKK